VKNINGTTPYGPNVFDDDTFACGSSSTGACFTLNGGSVTVENSNVDGGSAQESELVYNVIDGGSLALTDDVGTGDFATPMGNSDATSTVTVSGGSWQ
jgi:hypothetical protein